MAVHPLRGIAKSQIKLVVRTVTQRSNRNGLSQNVLNQLKSGIGLKGHEPVLANSAYSCLAQSGTGPKRYWPKAVLPKAVTTSQQVVWPWSAWNHSEPEMQIDSRQGRRTSGLSWCPFVTWRQFRRFWRVSRFCCDAGARSVVQENRSRCGGCHRTVLHFVKRPAASSEQGGPCTGSLGKGSPLPRCHQVVEVFIISRLSSGNADGAVWRAHVLSVQDEALSLGSLER